MEDNIVSAEDLLNQYGIKSVAFNTEEDDTVCHIIGHKQIYTNVSNNISYNTNGGNNNGTLGILEGTGKHGTIGYFSDDFQSGLRTDVFMDSTGMSCVGYSETFWNTLNSDGANDTDCVIKTNTNGGANNATLGVYKNVSGSGLERGFSWDDSSGLRSDDYNNSVFTSSGRYSEAFWKALNSDGANNTGFMIKTNTNTNTNGGNNNGYMGILEGTGECKSTGVISVSSSLWTNDSVDNIWSNHRRNSEIFWNTLRLNGANNSDYMRTLVVVDIRGSSTNKDWLTDVGTQFDPSWGSFGAGMEMVLKSLYHGTGETYVLLYRCVHSIILPCTVV